MIVNDVFQGSSVLFWILFVGVIAYAASYFARGWLAGHQYFALYGGLVFLESTSRFLFPLAVAIGIGSGLGVVGAGMAVAPFASLAVMPFALPRIRNAALDRLAAAPETLGLDPLSARSTPTRRSPRSPSSTPAPRDRPPPRSRRPPPTCRSGAARASRSRSSGSCSPSRR